MGTGDGSVLGTTQILNNGPTGSRFNLVLLSDGYQSGDMTQWANDAQQFVDYLRGTPPFDDATVMNRINVFRVDVTSTDRGADKPAACFGASASASATYFDSTYCGGGLQRLLVADNAIVTGVLTAQVPAWHQALVVVNDTEWGGSGGAIGVTSLSGGWEGIAVHEMGHSAFGLADEYEYYQGCGTGETGHDTYTGAEPGEPNVTIDSNRATIEWGALIDPATAMPTTSNANCAVCDPQPNPVGARTVGAFEGAYYNHCGVYRPEFHCMMRNLTRYFCGACARAIFQTLQPFSTVLSRVNVRAPDVNHVFSPTGTITVSDIAPALTPNGASGAGFLQSRLFPQAPAGTPAAGNYGYEYRIALDGASGGGPGACIRSLTVDFGPVLAFDYDGSGTASQVFTTTQGGLGSVGPSRAELVGDRLALTYDPPVCPGATAYFTGLTSAHPPRDVMAEVRDVAGNVYTLPAKAPNF